MLLAVAGRRSLQVLSLPSCRPLRGVLWTRLVSSSGTTAVIGDDDASLAVWRSAKPFNTIPGPYSFPLIGSLPDMIKNDDRKEYNFEKRYFLKLHDRFGPIVKLAFPLIKSSSVTTCDPEVFKMMLRIESKYPSRLFAMEENMSFIHKKINTPMFMFFSKGEEWKRFRSAMAKPILPRKVAMLSPWLYETATQLGDHWLQQVDENNYIHDIRDDLQKWALSGVADFAFNKELKVFDANNHESAEFVQSAIDFMNCLVKVLQNPPFYKFYPTAPYKAYANAVRKMHSIGEEIMKNRFEELQTLLEQDEDYIDSNRLSVIEYMLIDGKITKSEAISQACDLLAAGIDTTSTTATWLLHELAKRPDIQNDLLDEISRVCGEKETPDFADVQNLSLVRNCIKETLRLHPLLTAVFRATETNLVINGYQIPKGTTLIYSNYIAAKTTTGSDFYNFDPYRWYNKSNQDDSLTFTNVPFGFGVRMCYGRRLAELELYLLLVNIIRRFTLSTDQSTINKIQFSTVKPRDPVRLQINPR
jgi:cytochrome P450